MNNEALQIFIDFIPYDRQFLDDLVRRYPHECENIGEYLKDHSSLLWGLDVEYLEEFYDFLDGNGFQINKPRSSSQHGKHSIQIIPIYPVEEEKENNEKSPFTLDTYISAQTLYNTSVETCEEYILEYEEFLASWAFWVRVCRRMELLQLVPEGRCGSYPIPRPP